MAASGKGASVQRPERKMGERSPVARASGEWGRENDPTQRPDTDTDRDLPLLPEGGRSHHGLWRCSEPGKHRANQAEALGNPASPPARRAWSVFCSTIRNGLLSLSEQGAFV